MMRTFVTTRWSPEAARLLVLLWTVLTAGFAAHADVVYTLHAVTQSGQVFSGTFTIPAIAIPVPYPEFTLFPGHITQTTAGGTVLDTYSPNESDAEGSVRRFLFDGAHLNGRVYDLLYLYVEGSAFTNNLTVCTTTHVCNCSPAATCPSPNPEHTVSTGYNCSNPDYGYGDDPRCRGYDVQLFETATLTGVMTAVTPEPTSLLLLGTGLLSLPVVLRRRFTIFRT